MKNFNTAPQSFEKNKHVRFHYIANAPSLITVEFTAGGGGVLHYEFIRGCAPQGFLLRPNPRNLVRYWYPIPEYMSDIDTQSKK